MEKNNSTDYFLGALTILFIALKLMGYITWSWLWVLSPIWLPLAIIAAVVILVTIFTAIQKSIHK